MGNCQQSTTAPLHAEAVHSFFSQLDDAGIAAFVVHDDRFKQINRSLCILLGAGSESELIGAEVNGFLRFRTDRVPLGDDTVSFMVIGVGAGPSPLEKFDLETTFVPLRGEREGTYLGIIKHPSLHCLALHQDLFRDGHSANGSAKHGQHTNEQDSMEGFDHLLTWINARSNLSLTSYKPSTLMRRMGRRIADTRCKNCFEYLNLLKNSPDEERNLVEHLTVAFTRYFRNAETFRLLQERIIPDLVAARKEEIEQAMDLHTGSASHLNAWRDDIRIWSAGTASGEEAYSIAAIVFGACAAANLRPVIFATDVSEGKLNVARRGIYTADKCDPIPRDLKESCFQRLPNHNLKVSEKIRRLCVFGVHNLIVDPPYSNMDVILCRNVMIYFKFKDQERVIANLAWSLKPGGYLVLGNSESVLGSAADKFETVDRDLHIFQKRRGACRT